MASVAVGSAATLSADHLRGYPVGSVDGAVVGEVDDLLIDLEGGRMSYLLVRTGDSRRILVPWRAVRVQLQPAMVRLAIGAEKFRQAPTGGGAVGGRSEEQAIHQFFGVAPYWQGAPAGSRPAPPRNLRIGK